LENYDFLIFLVISSLLFIGLILNIPLSVSAQPDISIHEAPNCNNYHYSCPSSVYFDVHSSSSLLSGLPYALKIPGTVSNEHGAQIMELRGWIRTDGSKPQCFDKNFGAIPAECINTDPAAEFTYGLELDPQWMAQQGIDLNKVIRIGNILGYSDEHTRFTSGRAIVHVELMSWHAGQIFPGARPYHSDRIVPRPVGWDFSAHTNAYGDTFWPWDPRYPSNEDPISNPNASPLKEGDYVRIKGALVTDYPHTGMWIYPYPHTPNYHEDPSNPARYTEIHPPDLVERITPQRDQNSLSVECMAAVAMNGGLFDDGERIPFSGIVSAPSMPDPLAKMKFVENVDSDYTHLADWKVIPRSPAITVSGEVHGKGNYGDNGQFKACYTVYWESGPSQIRASIEPKTISNHIPGTFIVHAEDWHTRRPIDGTVLVDNKQVGKANSPFIYTFNSADEWSVDYNGTVAAVKVTSPGYIDTQEHVTITFPKLHDIIVKPDTVELDKQVTFTVNATDQGKPIQGKIFVGRVLETAEGLHINGKDIGDTNSPITYTFKRSFGRTHVDNSLMVVAPGYADTNVPLKFR
jgi:hypothetical protein